MAVAGGVVYMALRTPADPRTLALGEWKESSGHAYVDVTPDTAKGRGMLRGSVTYHWVQTEKEPYRLRFTYRQKEYEADVSFPDADTAVVEPDVWEQIPASSQRMLRDINRRHNRPENEMRLLFHRVKTPQHAGK